MDDDEVMKFEITEKDLEDEMTTSYARKRMSKNQATYGIWADNNDSEGEVEPKAGFGSNKGKRDFTAPKGFVSGGIVGQKKKMMKNRRRAQEVVVMRRQVGL
jgi:tuftelin-interacting protein 11